MHTLFKKKILQHIALHGAARGDRRPRVLECGRRDRLLVQSSAHRHAVGRSTIKHRHRTPRSLNTRASASRQAFIEASYSSVLQEYSQVNHPRVTALCARVMSRMRSVDRGLGRNQVADASSRGIQSQRPPLTMKKRKQRITRSEGFAAS